MIYAFKGNMRSGKSLGMTAWGVLLSHMTGQTLYANYSIQHKNFRKFFNWHALEGVKNSIILFDEIGTAIDSRNYKSRDQAEFTHLFAQMGKLGNTLMYTTQRMHLVEKRVRDNTDYIINCIKLWPTESLVQEWFDTQSSVETPTHIRTYSLKNPQPLYKLYDSFEVVKTNMKWANDTE